MNVIHNALVILKQGPEHSPRSQGHKPLLDVPM